MATTCPKCQAENPETKQFCSNCATKLDLSDRASLTRTLETGTDELTRGTTFAGRYEIIEELGKGGRNQEFVLAALVEMQKQFLAGSLERPRNWLVASFGTDGIDGGTDAAGAWATRDVLEKAVALGLDPQTYLDANDSYHFFQKERGLIMTGRTGTNVMDIRIVLLF
jgi:hypothetical protein